MLARAMRAPFTDTVAKVRRYRALSRHLPASTRTLIMPTMPRSWPPSRAGRSSPRAESLHTLSQNAGRQPSVRDPDGYIRPRGRLFGLLHDLARDGGYNRVAPVENLQRAELCEVRHQRVDTSMRPRQPELDQLFRRRVGGFQPLPQSREA